MLENKNDFQLRVYYEDTDIGGIVYHANYLKFFERARTEWLREKGITQSLFLEQKLGFVVTRVEIDYIASAKLDDLLNVSSLITEFKRASLLFSQKITNQHQQIICAAIVRIAFVDFTKARPCPIPKSILGALKRVS
ncbi:MAG: acyl-CoA thioester hydrolase [Alteromonadaceae bacterium]|jgi:acyl-CoA thioester hydrolase